MDEKTIRDWADESIFSIFSTPKMWGSSFEAIELQFLLLLQARACAFAPELRAREQNRIRDAYRKVLGEGTQFVHQKVREDEEDRFVNILRRIFEELHPTSVAVAFPFISS